MGPIDRAVWYIESHFAEDISLESVARNAALSRFHLTRAFALATGLSVMQYARLRRLSHAARLLAEGQDDVVAVAQAVGYQSHEGFTRAFRDCFGVTPQTVRRLGRIDTLDLLEPLLMNESPRDSIPEPRIAVRGPLLLAGLAQTHTQESSAGIPAQWQAFGPHIGQVPGQTGKSAYGVMYNGDEHGNMDYLAGVEVRDFGSLPAAFTRLRVPEQQFAIFAHPGHISTIRSTWHTIWSVWLPDSGFEPTDAPLIEFYPETFDPATGSGGLELWVPVR
jgi:AraC family transcriptional regulator